jgi:hypothetical protein
VQLSWDWEILRSSVGTSGLFRHVCGALAVFDAELKLIEAKAIQGSEPISCRVFMHKY